MNWKFWIKKPVYEAVVFCCICSKDLTRRDKIYWGDSAYCEICYKRQTCLGDLK